MRTRILPLLVASLLQLLYVMPLVAQEDSPLTLSSPDGDVVVTVSTSTGPLGSHQVHWAVSLRGEPALASSPLGLTFVDEEPFGGGVALRRVDEREVDDRWTRYWGRRSEVRNRFNELTVHAAETGEPGRSVDLVFRAYDDGVAFRYLLPEAWGAFSLASEETTFRIPGDPTVWAVTYGGHHSSQEAPFQQIAFSELESGTVYGLPMLVQLAESRWASLTEANLTDWAGMYLTPASSDMGGLQTSLAPLPDEPTVTVRSTAPRQSPWRVVMIADAPGHFLETDLIQNLNEPAESDFSWVKPGIASWNWWNGPYVPEADFEVGMNTATIKHYVDLAAEMGWRYVLIDEGWYGPAFAEGARATTWAKHPTSTITDAIPELDLQEVIRYANERGVMTLLWLHWGHVADQMQDAFPLYESWGVAGVKIDFMDRDDQEMVRYYHDVVRLAATHHLTVDFHGAYKPTGISRTYPNLITREGVMGNEYNKWSTRVTPEHNVTIPFTRGSLGEMDFTPGGFGNRGVDVFNPRDQNPFVMGTRAHQLAMFVVYESALQVASDSPHAYRSSPAGTDFLKTVPTTWDDTRVVAGYPGDYVAVARRSGDAWFIGVMSDEEARTLDIPLDFLGEGAFRAEVWEDAYDSGDYPQRLLKSARAVSADDGLTVRMAPGGGYVAHIVPVP